MGGGQEKTEKATAKKRSDSRMKDGTVLQSKEVNTAISILGVFFALSLLGNFMLLNMNSSVTFFISRMGERPAISQEYFNMLSLNIIRFCIVTAGPLLAIALLVGIIPSVWQTKGLFTMKPLKPKFSKLNPIRGAKKFFQIQAFVNVIKGVLIIAVIVTIVYFRTMDMLPEFVNLLDMELKQGVAFIARNIFFTIISIVVVFAFIAALDYIFQWWQYEKKLKMSKQEVKDEYKQIEGDPKIKSKIKQKQREIAQSRMMQDVPTADVVVRNPTHYAVALKYDTSIPFSAPKVIAKGKDHLALRIIEIAEEHGVHITEDRPLARTLHDTVKIGQEIPDGLYTAIASIFAEIESIKQKIYK